jgi:hypothetical protein
VSTTGRDVALSLLFGGPYLHINYFIIVIGIVIKLLNIKVNKKRIGLVQSDKSIAKPPFLEKGWVSGGFLEKPPAYGNNFALKVSDRLRVIDREIDPRPDSSHRHPISIQTSLLHIRVFHVSQWTNSSAIASFV